LAVTGGRGVECKNHRTALHIYLEWDADPNVVNFGFGDEGGSADYHFPTPQDLLAAVGVIWKLSGNL
jgi:hypothetical protein